MNKDSNHQQEVQRASQRLVSDYMSFLIDQEALVERVVERRLEELQPEMEKRIKDHIINQLKSSIK